MTATLAGTGPLLRLAWRRARVQLPIWIGVLLLVVLSTSLSFAQLYPTSAQRREFVESLVAKPALRALYGNVYNPGSLGGLVAWRLASSAPTALALMNLLLVVRHTRGEEESGRAELIGAQPTGRYAPLAAALGLTGLADLVFAGLAAVLLVGTGLPVSGSVAFGCALGLTGWVFAAVAGVSAQLAGTARAAAGLAGAVLAVAFGLRAAGDAAGNWLGWLSPLGWAVQVRAFGGDRWWVLGLSAAASAVLIALAVALRGHRDSGWSPFGSRPGPASGSRLLAGPTGLAWRLQAGTLLAWAVGLAVTGALLGGIAEDLRSVLDDSPGLADAVRRLGGQGSVVDAYLGATIGLIALAVAGYTVQATLRLRSEETEQRADLVLCGDVGRARWALGHAIWAGFGTVLLLVVAGLAMGLAVGVRGHDVSGQLPRILRVCVLQAPAGWLLGALVLAAFGTVPRLVWIGWAALAGSVLISELGSLLRLPSWVLDSSPFAHTPTLGAPAAARVGVVLLLLLSVLLVGTAVWALRRRDLNG